MELKLECDEKGKKLQWFGNPLLLTWIYTNIMIMMMSLFCVLCVYVANNDDDDEYVYIGWDGKYSNNHHNFHGPFM